jgi:molybdopterin-guanine dinucleotide biosynthesis protein A
MGREKALLELGGKPLVAHAVEKLRRFCSDVFILTASQALSDFAPTVPDQHLGCGPMGGMEAALSHSQHDWNLILPVDVPFLPTVLIETWAATALNDGQATGTRIAMFEVDGLPQPALLMLHRDVAPYLTASLERGEFKVGPTLHYAAADLAAMRGLEPDVVLRRWQLGSKDDLPATGAVWGALTEAQKRSRNLWFANLNTPEEFENARANLDALDG